MQGLPSHLLAAIAWPTVVPAAAPGREERLETIDDRTVVRPFHRTQTWWRSRDGGESPPDARKGATEGRP